MPLCSRSHEVSWDHPAAPKAKPEEEVKEVFKEEGCCVHGLAKFRFVALLVWAPGPPNSRHFLAFLGSGTRLKMFPDAIRFVLAEFQAVLRHGGPVRAKFYEHRKFLHHP